MAINENAVTDTLTPTTGTLTVAGTESVQNINITGTGENLFLYSNTFNNSYWKLATGLATPTNTITDPFGGSTAWAIPYVSIYQSFLSTIFLVSGVTYTISYWLQATSGTRTFVLLGASSSTNYGNITATTTWTRYSTTFTMVSTEPLYILQDRNASGFQTLNIYGAQLEIGSVANTYIPTTTTAIYGTPTLNFSGVSSIGLQNDGSLYVSPAGTGALQAQQTTSSITGGNARGANAVDWQTTRTAATQVASTSGSVIGGGANNGTGGAGANSVIGGGVNNNTTGAYQGVVGGGGYNVLSNYYSVIAGGYANNVGGQNSVISGGLSNSAQGYHNIIVGGYANSGTSASAVTTQATTTVTSGSTAVTLSASNASIKVGQIVTGTGIVGSGTGVWTYVAAISGTTLTLSQNANASGSPTLSFYTPHGIVVGGGNNQATGSYSFIGGGGDAGTSANRNVASGDWSFVGGGWANKAVGNASSVVGGGVNGSGTTAGNTANATSSYIGGGFSNTVSINGFSSTIGGGSFNNTTASHTTIAGGRYGTDRGITGYTVFPACYQPITNASGVSQSALLIIAKQTTDATATVLTCDANAASTNNQVILPNNSAYYFKVSVIANVTGGGNTKAWTLEGAIKRGSGVGTAAIVGTVTTNIVAADTGTSGWAVTATADTTNGGLAITVTGQASTTIRWVAKCETAEVTY